MDTCPACGTASIPSWKRWTSLRKFQGGHCDAWIWLPQLQVRWRTEYPNFLLFVVAPLFCTSIPLVLAYVIGKVPVEFQAAGALSFFVVGVTASFIPRVRQKYVVSETQHFTTEWQDVRAAWKVREARLFMCKMLLSSLLSLALMVAVLKILRGFVDNRSIAIPGACEMQQGQAIDIPVDEACKDARTAPRSSTKGSRQQAGFAPVVFPRA